jgi:hypothetical protein
MIVHKLKTLRGRSLLNGYRLKWEVNIENYDLLFLGHGQHGKREN